MSYKLLALTIAVGVITHLSLSLPGVMAVIG